MIHVSDGMEDDKSDSPESSDDQRVKDGIEIVRKVPAGYLGIKHFAARVQCNETTVSRARNSGRLAKDRLLWFDSPGGAKRQLLIHEDQIDIFNASKRKTKPGPKSQPKPSQPKPDTHTGIKLELVDDDPAEDATPAPPKENQTEIDFSEIPRDLHDARLKNEQLKALRSNLELQRARNEIVDVELVEKRWTSMAVQIRQQMLAIVARLAPVLAAETNVHSCSEILEQAITDALRALKANSAA
jgi:hypothetical protein